MAAQKRPLRVVISNTAKSDLFRVWDWNASQYSQDHANSYVTDLYLAAIRLGDNPYQGTMVTKDRRFIVIRKNKNTHGHVIVYRVTPRTVRILHVFHTSQNWRARLTRKKR